MAMTSYSERMQDKPSKVKEHGVESGRNQTQASKGPLSVESHRTCLGLLARSCDNQWERMSIREAPTDSVSRVLLAAGHIGPF